MHTPVDVNITAMADLHIGCPKIDLPTMYDNLVRYLYPEIAKSQIFFFAGDFFDTLQNLSSRSVLYALKFMYDLMSISDKYGTQIRIVHGTYSHDRNQLSVFDAFAKHRDGQKFLRELPTLGKMKIADKIEAEEIRYITDGKSGTLRVLYLPDSLPFKRGEEVISKLKDVLGMVGWEQADMVVGHGTFEHVMPSGIPLPPCTYMVDMFNEVVTGPIVMGHIHVHSKRKHMVYTGSFERIAHNEEAAKGYITLSRINGIWTYHFKVNPGALKFITIYPHGTTQDEIIADYISQVEKKFDDLIGYVRVLHEDTDIRSILSKITISKFPQLVYSSKSTKVETDIKLKTMDDYSREVNDTVVPTEENLDTLVYKFIKERPSLAADMGDLTQEDVTHILHAK